MSDETNGCPQCFGWGFTLMDCKECDGSGMGDPYTSPNCMECNGTGVLEMPCKNPECEGKTRKDNRPTT
ncbi:MAG: hypothetical protein HN929_00720 [Chloroflexi bacterium]|nr:hypothetical protein [Chloroflexota bacterium]MBT7079988.1 hypothetical protein [Chloroflexota bacterium]MBT7290575.1 hypothetical protein [Chloroflexota bacterium]